MHNKKGLLNLVLVEHYHNSSFIIYLNQMKSRKTTQPLIYNEKVVIPHAQDCNKP